MQHWARLAMDVEALKEGVFDTPATMDALADGLAALLGITLPGRDAFLHGPFGPSYVRYGSRGRMAIHVWPERRVATVDVWMNKSDLLNDGEALIEWLEREHSIDVLDYRVTDVDM